MWCACILLCRDIELACDEKVTGRLVSACRLPFGEVGVKTRIKSLLQLQQTGLNQCFLKVKSERAGGGESFDRRPFFMVDCPQILRGGMGA